MCICFIVRHPLASRERASSSLALVTDPCTNNWSFPRRSHPRRARASRGGRRGEVLRKFLSNKWTSEHMEASTRPREEGSHASHPARLSGFSRPASPHCCRGDQDLATSWKVSGFKEVPPGGRGRRPQGAGEGERAFPSLSLAQKGLASVQVWARRLLFLVTSRA